VCSMHACTCMYAAAEASVLIMHGGLRILVMITVSHAACCVSSHASVDDIVRACRASVRAYICTCMPTFAGCLPAAVLVCSQSSLLCWLRMQYACMLCK
jgi:hypothetical protein